MNLIDRELAGLLPTLPARPKQFDKCNRCSYTFKRDLKGDVDKRDMRVHKVTCIPTVQELFPPQAFVFERFPHLLEQQHQQVPVLAVVAQPPLPIAARDIFERRQDPPNVAWSDIRNTCRRHQRSQR